MSDFSVEVVRIGAFTKNPNADTLMVTEVLGSPVQFKEGDFQVGDLAVYIPIESMVPVDRPEFAWLKNKNHPNRTHERIRAMRLRGIFSMGFLIPTTYKSVGKDVAKDLGVYKYEEPEDVPQLKGTPWQRFWKKWKWRLLSLIGKREPKKVLPVYDVENIRKNKDALVLGEEVVLTEKIHGCNARHGWYKGKFYIGSHKMYRDEKDLSPKNYWTKIAHNLDLKEKLRPYPGIAIYGEIFGNGIQDLEYGMGPQQMGFRVFDVRDIDSRRWWNYDEMAEFVTRIGLEVVPVLYRGPWQGLEAHAPLGEGATTIGANGCGGKTQKRCIREGWVVKPVIERHHPTLGRANYKYIGEAYLTRKGDITERH